MHLESVYIPGIASLWRFTCFRECAITCLFPWSQQIHTFNFLTNSNLLFRHLVKEFLMGYISFQRVFSSLFSSCKALALHSHYCPCPLYGVSATLRFKLCTVWILRGNKNGKCKIWNWKSRIILSIRVSSRKCQNYSFLSKLGRGEIE